ncbi:hypothetical protein [Nevskia soli]|uniref:hypothetical protein n=1 Tax=Nevskia soli TaxID=418856 RepID=UPI0004A747E1|nr:hypothetical protein [Nevskia soli]
MSPLIFGIGGSMLALNTIVSFCVLFSRAYIGSQKALQLLLIWLLPVLGALVAFWMFAEDQRETTRLTGDRFDPPMNPPGIQ